MKLFITIAAFVLASAASAQKKLVPVSQSSVTGLTLPEGSKKDGRLLIEMSAKALLQMEAKKTGAAVNKIEVLYLPQLFTMDSLNALFSNAGWTSTVSPTDNKYYWLQKDSRSILAYCSAGKNQFELYFGESNAAPETGNNTPVQQDQQQTVQQPAPPQIDNQAVQQQQNSTPVNNQAVQQSGFSFSTTNFDDGWTSVIQNDGVLVSKAGVNVLLVYALPYNASQFSGTGVRDRDYYWDTYVPKYFNIQIKQYNDAGEVLTSSQPDYVEGWGTDKQTGERKFIAMRLSVAPNTAYLTIASTADEATFRQQFPNANGKYTSDLASMDRYNKFAVAANDILGQWEKGGTSTMQWYYTAPSGYESYAGMTVAATSAIFRFNGGGNYSSTHNGATGTVGSMNTFQQEYKGKYTVTNWNVVATNRWEGKTDNFDAWFEAINGGRVLCLRSGGMEYRLVKTK
ncbi:hypothetical protein [Ferruginibacter sp.]